MRRRVRVTSGIRMGTLRPIVRPVALEDEGSAAGRAAA
jgi:hypothetical protein